MRALHLIILDIRNGIAAKWYRGALAAVLFLFIDAVVLAFPPAARGEQMVAPSLGDYYVNLFAGMSWSAFDPEMPVVLPIAWLSVTFFILYITLDYPYEELHGIGKHLAVLSGDRVSWWAAKCLWVLLVVLLYFLTWLVVTVLWVIATKGNLDFATSSNTAMILGYETDMLLQSSWALSGFVIVTLFTVCALCLFQMFFSLCLKPIFAFMISVILLFISNYIASPFLIGNYLMATRSQTFISSGLDWVMGTFISAWIILAAVVFGGWYFSRMDVLAREG